MPAADDEYKEAKYFHAALFRGVPFNPDLGQRYNEARQRFFQDDRAADLIGILVEERLDAEAVEFALRFLGCPNGLTRRFQVMSSLAEVRNAYYDHFVQTRDRRLAAWLSLPRHLVRTIWKLAKGLALVFLFRLRRFADV